MQIFWTKFKLITFELFFNSKQPLVGWNTKRNSCHSPIQMFVRSWTTQLLPLPALFPLNVSLCRSGTHSWMFPWQPRGLLSILSLPVLFPSSTPRPASDHPKMGGGGARQRGRTVKVTFLHHLLDEQTLCIWRQGEQELQGRG